MKMNPMNRTLNVLRFLLIHLGIRLLIVALIGTVVMLFRNPTPQNCAWFFLTVVILWVLGSYEGECDSTNGGGTALWGETPTYPKGFISTKWIVLFGVPLIPIRSIQILDAAQLVTEISGLSVATSAKLITKPLPTGRFYWRSVAPTIAMVWGPIAFFFYLSR